MKGPFLCSWRTSFNYSNSDSPGVLGFFKLNTKVEIYAKWYIYIYVICIPHRDCVIMGMCLNKVLVRRILMTVKTVVEFYYNESQTCVSKVG